MKQLNINYLIRKLSQVRRFALIKNLDTHKIKDAKLKTTPRVAHFGFNMLPEGFKVLPHVFYFKT